MAAIVASKVKRQRKEANRQRTESASTVHSSQLQLIHRFNHEEDSGKSSEVSNNNLAKEEQLFVANLKNNL